MQSKTSKITPSNPLNRRKFIALSGMAAGALVVPGCSSPRRTLSASDKLNILCVGAGGKGATDIDHCASENVIAICDVDEAMAAPTLAKFPKAKFYKDWRVMFEREKTADAVTVSTPDHTHATIAAQAMRMRMGVYCQKPLTHSINECRTLRDLARKYKVVTQLGNQGSAVDGLRRAIEVVQAGLIGPVRNVHVWTNRPKWPQGMDRPSGSDPIPPGLDWNLWIGPAPMRPFKNKWPEPIASTLPPTRNKYYHPFNWRGWQDFGTGAIGDMGCHTVNMPYRALKLGAPSWVQAESSGMNSESYPEDSRIRFAFPKRGELPEVDLWWYAGGRLPDEFLQAHIKKLMDEVPISGCLLVGDKGLLFSPDSYGTQFFVKLWDDDDFVPGSQHEAVEEVPRSLPRNRFRGDGDSRHVQEWIAACKGDGTCYSGFEIGAELTETLLLGCVALHSNEQLQWDPQKMKFTNAPQLNYLLTRKYREGWTL